jgi:hypothetical protein
MKLKTIVLITLLLELAPQAYACPTCASSLDDYTPPFFSEEFYKPYENKTVTTQEVTDEGDEDEEKDVTMPAGVPAPAIPTE